MKKKKEKEEKRRVCGGCLCGVTTATPPSKRNITKPPPRQPGRHRHAVCRLPGFINNPSGSRGQPGPAQPSPAQYSATLAPGDFFSSSSSSSSSSSHHPRREGCCRRCSCCEGEEVSAVGKAFFLSPHPHPPAPTLPPKLLLCRRREETGHILLNESKRAPERIS